MHVCVCALHEVFVLHIDNQQVYKEGNVVNVVHAAHLDEGQQPAAVLARRRDDYC